MNNIPVIFFHLTVQIHVKVALQAAASHNQEVIIITDTDHPDYRQYATLARSTDYQSPLEAELARSYRHLSSSTEEFEYTCIRRWFVLLEYMKQHHCTEAVYIDSDVMTFSDYTPVIRANYSDKDLCLCIPEQTYESFNWLASGHISYWTIDALEAFCNYVIELYTQHQQALEPKWQWHQSQGQPGGICDMTLLYLFQRQTKLRCGNLLEIAADGSAFDIGFNTSLNQYPGEYHTHYARYLDGEIKTLRFRDGHPYALQLPRQQEIRMHGLHFQGGSKRLMPFYQRPRKLPLILNWMLRYAYLDLRIWLSLE